LKRWRVLLTSSNLALLAAVEAGAQGTHGPGWTLALGLQEAVYGNARFAAPDGGLDVVSGIQAALDRGWALRRGGVQLGGEVGEELHRGSADLDRFTYGMSAAAGYQLSRRAALGLTYGLHSSYIRDVAALSAAGLLPPLTFVRMNDAEGTVAYLASRRTEVRLALRDERVHFESPGFHDGSTFATRVALARQGRRSTTGGSYEYQRVTNDGAASGVHGLLATWEGTFGRPLSVRAAGGADLYKLPGQDRTHVTPSGEVGLGGRFGRTTLGLSYSRSIDQAFGFGRLQLLDAVSLRYGLEIGPRLGLDAAAEQAWSRDPGDPAFRLRGRVLSTGVRWALGRGLGLGVGYSYWRRQEVPSPAASTHHAAMSLTYRRSWR